MSAWMIIAVTALMGMVAAGAAEQPEPVTQAVDEAATACLDMGGEPDTAAMPMVDDLNGDGAEDWIVDYGKLGCAGTTNPFCGTGGCTLEIYLWTADATWTRVLEETAREHAVRGEGRNKIIEIVTGGNACDRPNFENCMLHFRFEGTRVVPIK